MRNRRKRLVRGRSISVRSLTKIELAVGAAQYPERDYWRPVTRGDCERFSRPCPFVACKFNLYLTVSPDTGSIKFNFPDIEPDEMGESCVLDVADSGGETLERVGEHMNIVRERVRQIENDALSRLHLPILRAIVAEDMSRDLAEMPEERRCAQRRMVSDVLADYVPETAEVQP